MSNPHETLDLEPKSAFSSTGRQETHSTRRRPVVREERFSPTSYESEAWGLAHKRLIFYWAIYIAVFTAIMMFFL
jgi:hypothetical protein